MSDYSPSDALPTIQNLTSRVRQLEAELADLRASSVVVRKKCRGCLGAGRLPTDRQGDKGECMGCGGDGWQLAEGVRKITPAVKVYDKIIGDYVFPARLIERDTDAGD